MIVPADGMLPGDNQSLSNLVFSVSSSILVYMDEETKAWVN